MFGKTDSALTEKDVLEALKGVKDPDLGRDLVDLGMIKNVRIGDGVVALAVNLTTPACPLKGKIEADVRQALTSRLPGGWTFEITMTADVRGKSNAETGDCEGRADRERLAGPTRVHEERDDRETSRNDQQAARHRPL